MADGGGSSESTTETTKHAADVLADLTGRPVETFRESAAEVPDFEDQEVLKTDE